MTQAEKQAIMKEFATHEGDTVNIYDFEFDFVY